MIYNRDNITRKVDFNGCKFTWLIPEDEIPPYYLKIEIKDDIKTKDGKLLFSRYLYQIVDPNSIIPILTEDMLKNKDERSQFTDNIGLQLVQSFDESDIDDEEFVELFQENNLNYQII